MKGLYDKLTSTKVLRPFAITLYVIIKRAVPIVALALLLGIGATLLDRHNVRNAPASEFVNYYAFDVTNARESEDVYFKVCRRHDVDYRFNGDLTVLVYRNADLKQKPVPVYSKGIKGGIAGDCENKVLRATDFAHQQGTYKMAFCVSFRVKYDIEKTACKDSNIYKIYAAPADISSRIDFYENQLNILRSQLNEANGVMAPSQPDAMTAPAQPRAATAAPAEPAPQQPVSNVSPQQTNPPPAPPRPCVLNALGLGALCR